MWGPSSQASVYSSTQLPPPPSGQSLSQPSPHQVPASNIVNSTVYELMHLPKQIAGPNYKEFGPTLPILYVANDLPTFTGPEELHTILASATTTTSASGITVAPAALADLLCTASQPQQSTSDQLPLESTAFSSAPDESVPDPPATPESGTCSQSSDDDPVDVVNSSYASSPQASAHYPELPILSPYPPVPVDSEAMDSITLSSIKEFYSRAPNEP
nr:mucin-7-like [Procambarus clarkii]